MRGESAGRLFSSRMAQNSQQKLLSKCLAHAVDWIDCCRVSSLADSYHAAQCNFRRWITFSIFDTTGERCPVCVGSTRSTGVSLSHRDSDTRGVAGLSYTEDLD